jgi:enoyl-CoA hydratase
VGVPDLLTESADGVAVVTLNRPGVRNALDRSLLEGLRRTMTSLDADPHIRCIVLTGADPAFCAGLDLRVLGSDGGGGALLGDVTPNPAAPNPAAPNPAAPNPAAPNPAAPGGPATGAPAAGGFWPTLSTPVVGAINGPAVTGGLEVALQCDIRIASERARFADTHARVGVMPAGGMTVRLPAAVGLSRALEMSLTGRFVGAAEAAAWGLIGTVVAHDDLLPAARKLAAAVAEVEPAAASTILAMYHRCSTLPGVEAFAAELEVAAAWRREHFDPSTVAARRDGVIARGRSLAAD